MMPILPLIITTAVVLLILCLDYLGSRFGQYRYSDDNPFTRYCRQCGQRQDQYQFASATIEPLTWWEDIRPVPDPACACHRDAAGRG